MLIINKDMNIKQRIQQMDDSKREKLGEVVRFGIVGVAATILQYVIYLVMIPSLVWGLPQLGGNDHVLATTANTIAYIASFVFNFIASTRPMPSEEPALRSLTSSTTPCRRSV